MKRKGQANGVLALSIGLILAVIILSVVFAFISDQTTTTTITGDQFTANNESCVRVTSNCISSLTNVLNGTGGADATGNYSLCTVAGDVNRNAGLLLDPGDSTANIQQNGATMNTTYDERSCGFITSGTTRTLVTLIPTLLAIAALVFAVGFLVLRK